MPRIRKVLFVGSKRPGLRCLQEMHQLDPGSIAGVMTLDDRDDSRSAFDEFVDFTSKAGARLLVAKNRRDSEAIIMDLAPELCIVHGWYWLISDQTLESVPRGFLGFHNSLLPRYRGGSPLVWTIINGEDVAGITLFSFSTGMDEGDIWAQESVTIEPGNYVSAVLSKLGDKAASILREKYLQILDGNIRPVTQDHGQATYCAQRIPDDGLIDWRKSSKQVYDFVRAQAEPYPGAFAFHNREKLIVWRARPGSMIYYGSPGQVARIREDGVYVICGDNRPIVLEELEFGKHRDRANKIITSIKTRFSAS